MYLEFSYDKSALLKMPKRYERSYKGTYGRLLCVCGSKGMSGAAYLSALAAYRTGVGLVEILTAEENLIPLQTSLPEAIVTVYGTSFDPDPVINSVRRADSIVLGCGMGTDPVAL